MGRSQQLCHIEDVIATVECPTSSDRDPLILQSWQRCVDQHGLDPTVRREAVILPSERVREHAERIEAFLRVARHGAESLYRTVTGMGYVMLLTDKQGITVDFIGDDTLLDPLKQAGLYLGADWHETRAGTCGVGTCISTGQALTVHRTDHFDATHIPLTCTVAPIFDPFGELLAVLDISALESPEPKTSQHLALQLVRIYAHRIENANFLHQFRTHWIVRLGESFEFVDADADYLFALDNAGCLLGFNHRAHQLLDRELGAANPPVALLGRRFDRFFDCDIERLPDFAHFRPAEQRAIRTRKGGCPLFALVTPPAPLVCRPRETSPPAELPKPLARLSGGDPTMDRLLQQAHRLIDTRLNLLLLGETGTGKECVARALHQASLRAERPFIAVNCAAIPESLIESELFGYAPGTFTGARNRGHRGLILEAHGGTLLLDEIGDMPLPLQSRLLRVLAEQEVTPLGSAHPVPVDIRVIAATHCDLQQRVRRGEFRDDLYYRLNGAVLELPPLRERRDLDHLIRQLLIADHPHPPEPSPDVLALLRHHDWPGNIRELRNVLQYAAAVCGNGRIEARDLPDRLRCDPECPHHEANPLPADAARPLLHSLQRHRWNISATARDLGICRATVYRRMQRYGIEPPHWG